MIVVERRLSAQEDMFMQQTAVPIARQKRGIALSSGGILGLIGGILILVAGIYSGFHNVPSTSPQAGLVTILILVGLLGTPLLAGLIGTVRSGRFGTGVLSGLWDGFLAAIFLDIYIVILYFLNPPTAPSAQSVQQAQSILTQYGINVSSQSIQNVSSPQSTLMAVIFAGLVLLIVWLGVGAFLGIIGAAIGKIFVHHPRDLVIDTLGADTGTGSFPRVSYPPQQQQYPEDWQQNQPHN